jgi:hypothetical protein
VTMNCGDRLCEPCNRRRYGVLFNHYKPFFSKFIPGSLRFVTLTLKNQSDLASMHQKLVRCVHELIEHGKKHWGWCGGVVAYQATNIGNGWHDHAHMLVEGGDFVPQDELVRVWTRITGDSFIVGITLVLDVEHDLGYMIGYALRTDKVWLEFHGEYNQVFRGRRLLQSWGTWFNRMISDELKKEFACPQCGAVRWNVILPQKENYPFLGMFSLWSLMGSSP